MNNIELENIKKASVREELLKLEEQRTDLENLKKRIEFIREGLCRNENYKTKYIDTKTDEILAFYLKRMMDTLKPCVCDKTTNIDVLEEVIREMLMDAILDEFELAVNEFVDLLGSPESKKQ